MVIRARTRHKYSIWLRQHSRQQRSARPKVLEYDRLVAGMRAFANRSHPVEGRNAENRSEITVRCTAGGRFVENEPKFACKRASLSKKPRCAARALHGRPVDAAGDGKFTALVCRFQHRKSALDPRSVGDL